MAAEPAPGPEGCVQRNACSYPGWEQPSWTRGASASGVATTVPRSPWRSARAQGFKAHVGQSQLLALCVPLPACPSPSLPQVRPQAGFDPSWRGPVVAAVVVISLLISSLLFASLASFKKQRLMLHETMVRPDRTGSPAQYLI